MVSKFITKANLFIVFITEKRLSDTEIREGDILLTMKDLNPTKAQGWDNVFIRIIQPCGNTIVKTLKYLFE